MRRNFLCFDKNGYVRSLLHVNRNSSTEICEATIYIAANKTKSPSYAKWILLKVENTEENSIVENSLFIKPFFSIVERKFYPNIELFPFQLYYDVLDRILATKRFEESGNTVKEYNSRKYMNGIPPVEEMSPSQLKLSL